MKILEKVRVEWQKESTPGMRQQPDYKSAGQNFNEWWKCSVTLLFFVRYKSAQISQNSSNCIFAIFENYCM